MASSSSSSSPSASIASLDRDTIEYSLLDNNAVTVAKHLVGMLNAKPGTTFKLEVRLKLKPPAEFWDAISKEFDPDTRPSYSDDINTRSDIVGQYAEGVFTMHVRALSYGRVALLISDLPFHRLDAHLKRMKQSGMWMNHVAALQLHDLQKRETMDGVVVQGEPIQAGVRLPSGNSMQAEYKHFFPRALLSFDQLISASQAWNEHIVDGLLNTYGRAKIVVGIEDDGFVTGIRLGLNGDEDLESKLQYFARKLCHVKIFPPLSANAAYTVEYQVLPESEFAAMSNPVYVRIEGQVDGVAHSLVHLFQGRAAVISDQEDNEAVFLVCSKADVDLLKANPQTTDSFVPRDKARAARFYESRQFAIDTTWMPWITVPSGNVQAAMLITITIATTSYKGSYWIDADSTGGTHVRVVGTESGIPTLGRLSGTSTWLRLHTLTYPVFTQLQSEFFVKVLYTDKRADAHPSIRFSRVYSPTGKLDTLIRQFRTRPRSYIIVIDVEEIAEAIGNLYHSVKQASKDAQIILLALASIESKIYECFQVLSWIRAYPNVSVDFYPSLDFPMARDTNDDADAVASTASHEVETCLSAITIDHSLTHKQIQTQARTWLSYLDPTAMSWELVAKGYIVRTRQIQMIVRLISTARYRAIGLVKYLRGSGATSTLRCVAYNLQLTYRVFLVNAVPSILSLYKVLQQSSERVLLVCDEDVAYADVNRLLSQLPSKLTKKAFLLYVRSQHSTPQLQASHEELIEPFLSLGDAQTLCSQLAAVFNESRDALNEAVATLKRTKNRQDSHIFIFGITACLGRYRRASELANTCYRVCAWHRTPSSRTPRCSWLFFDLSFGSKSPSCSRF